MSLSQIKPNVAQKILIYIEYILQNQGYKLSYTDMRLTLKQVNGTEYSIGTLRKQISILRSQGLITNKLRYRKPVPILSLEGKLIISTLLPYKTFGAWDNKWRIVIVQTPAKQCADRNKFISQLYKVGFKRIQKHVFISPHALLPTAHRHATYFGIRQYCLMFETDDVHREEQIIEKIWNLDEINKQYMSFIKLTKRKMKQQNDLWPFTAKKLEKMFADIYNTDPHLPQELLPNSWPAQEAYALFKAVSRSY